MQRPFDRRHFVNALLTSAAASGVAAALGGCAGSGEFEPGTTSAIGPSDRETGRNRERDVVKVGLILPLGSGPQIAAIAKSLRQAAEMAVFERPNAGLQLVVKDDKGTPEGAKAAAEELVKASVELIAGPVFSRSVQPTAQVAKAHNIPVLAFSNDPAVAGKGAYLMSFLAEVEIGRVIQHAGDKGRRVFAALLPKDYEGKVAEPLFRAAVQRIGGRVAFVESYDVDQGGIVEPGRKLKDLFQSAESGEQRIDTLFIPAGSDTLPQISYLIGQAKIDTTRVKLIGTSGWDYPNVGRDARLHSAWFASADPSGWREFSSRFAKAHGHLPPRIASLAFDAVDFASALATEPKGARFTAQNLTRASGFVGVDGPVRLTANGRNERALAVLEVQKPGATVIEPAPATMAAVSPGLGPALQRSAAGLTDPHR